MIRFLLNSLCISSISLKIGGVPRKRGGSMMMILVLGQLLYHYPKLSAQHRLVIPSVRGIREIRVL